MEYYMMRSGGVPVAIFRYNRSSGIVEKYTRIVEKYTRKTMSWVRDWWMMALFMAGDLGPGDKISEEEALMIVEGFG